MSDLYLSSNTRAVLGHAREIAVIRRHEFITPEHILFSLLHTDPFLSAIEEISPGSAAPLIRAIQSELNSLEHVPENCDCEPEFSVKAEKLINNATSNALNAGRSELRVEHLVYAYSSIGRTASTVALNALPDFGFGELLQAIGDNMEPDGELEFIEDDNLEKFVELFEERPEDYEDFLNDDEWEADDSETDPFDSSETPFPEDSRISGKRKNSDGSWHKLVTCINDLVATRNPLVGRESELERTIRVLCRKEKNNPLHVGEPGVGKTALIFGLARMIEEGDVPPRLKGARIYSMDMGSLVAGTRMRGDFEERLGTILKGAAEERNVILYIDEIHTMMGAGATSESSLDASNMLKPYLEEGRIRFIGATTFEENKRTFARNKALARRFQEIEIKEPSVEETAEILSRLQPHYEDFHGVSFDDGVMHYAAEMAALYIKDRFLPDKAIDLIDEAGAYRQIHPSVEGNSVVDMKLIAEILSRMAKVDALAMKEEQEDIDARLGERILSRIYGQDKAVEDVVEAVLMARAGLSDASRPMGSFLFVGPTGVGKTELSRVLADELRLGLVRLDMSEYTEKHSVAKLIGAPAGYVGYDDGGILTDAIRKTPNCVLLLDEIEKAHPDIYNILLQVMDYGKLTDNRGNAADFSNVILIMTSNAGAQFASRSRLGFESSSTPSESMVKEVKRLFKPEFINRLNGVVSFNSMDDVMALRILDKFIGFLRVQLEKRDITLVLSEEAKKVLLKEGFTREYGARELDRVLERRIKRPLSREILFGGLRHGGVAHITAVNGDIHISVE